MNILSLSAYPMPNVPGFGNTRKGIHGTAFADHPIKIADIDYLASVGYSWLKILSRPNGNPEVAIDHALNKGMAVIVRMYRERPNPRTLDPEQLNTIARWGIRYAGKPVYIQFNNEPDLPVEWENDIVPGNWLDIVARNAIIDSRAIQARGMIPVLPACATGSPFFYYYRLIPHILAQGGADIFDNKKICFGTHNYTTNHPVGDETFYDKPYPFDSVNQSGSPLKPQEYESFPDWEGQSAEAVNQRRARDKNVGQKLTDYGAAMSCLAFAYQYHINVEGHLPAPIPFLELEGGVSTGALHDARYARVTHKDRADRHKVISNRYWNTSVPYAYPAFCFNTADWLLDGDGSMWPEEGWLSSGQPRNETLREYFAWHKANAKDMRGLYNGTIPAPPMIPYDPSNTPAPVPVPPEPIDTIWEGFDAKPWIKDTLTLTKAEVLEGEEYWHLDRIRFIDEDEAGGLHHIYIMEPHTSEATVNVWSHLDQTGWDIRLDEKPEGEPAANHMMYGWGRKYRVRMNGLVSDVIDGLELIGNRHIVYELTFKKVRKMNTATMRGYPGAIVKRALHFNDRPWGTRIDGIVLHATAGSLEGTLSHFANPYPNDPQKRASAHYVIAKDGTIYQCVSDEKRAWHAGDTSFNGRTDWNNFTIGVELVNMNDGIDPYPQAQRAALMRLLRWLKDNHPVDAKFVQGHDVIAIPKGRKADPRGLNIDAIRDELFNTVDPYPVPRDEFIREADNAQVIRFNPNASVQQAIARDGFVPNSPEIRYGDYVIQRAEHLVTGERRVYYVRVNDWSNVNNFTF